MSKTQLLASTAAGTLYADEDEKTEERRDTAPATEIMDAVTRCMDAVERMADSFGKRFDRMDARMDAAEEKLGDRARRHDESEEEERRKREEAREDKRHDASTEAEREENEEERKENEEERKENEEERQENEENREERHGDATAETLAAIRGELAQLRAENRDLRRIVPRPISDSESAKLLEVQALADSVYIENGQRAPGPLVNEDLSTYRRRLAVDLQKHSPRLKSADLWAIADEAAFTEIEKMVYADAVETFKRPPVTDGLVQLRSVTRKSGGHEFTEYHGDSSAPWMGPLSLNAVRGRASVTEVMRAMGGDRR